MKSSRSAVAATPAALFARSCPLRKTSRSLPICQRIYLTTTNDNTNAIRFYQRSGWQFSALHKGIVDRVRAMKPDLALLGFDNIQIRDEIEFERWLCAANGSHA